MRCLRRAAAAVAQALLIGGLRQGGRAQALEILRKQGEDGWDVSDNDDWWAVDQGFGVYEI